MSLIIKNKLSIYDGNNETVLSGFMEGYITACILKGSKFMGILDHEVGVYKDSDNATCSIVYKIPTKVNGKYVIEEYPTGVVRLNICPLKDNKVGFSVTFVKIDESKESEDTIKYFKELHEELIREFNSNPELESIREFKSNIDFINYFTDIVKIMESIHLKVSTKYALLFNEWL